MEEREGNVLRDKMMFGEGKVTLNRKISAFIFPPVEVASEPEVL